MLTSSDGSKGEDWNDYRPGAFSGATGRAQFFSLFSALGTKYFITDQPRKEGTLAGTGGVLERDIGSVDSLRAQERARLFLLGFDKKLVSDLGLESMYISYT